MKNLFHLSVIAVWLLFFNSCTCSDKSITVSVSNSLDIVRSSETVKVDLAELKTTSADLIVVDEASGEEVLAQLVDEDADSTYEAILFQVALKANESRKYIIKQGKSSIEPSEVKTYARFVPERTDDFTWENDKVAFRVYGPTAQKMVEDGVPGGTLSGGVDCWLKKVDYSIINKWYKGNDENPGYYHNDHGEGLDNYHVGSSLGCGGTGVMIDNELVPSLNYTGYNVLLNGPVESKFELDYAPYGSGDISVQEKKTLAIDLGDNLTKFTIEVEGTDQLTTGITLHEKEGEISVDSTAVWVGYWSPHFGKKLGNAIVVDPEYYAGVTHLDSDVKDKSHILVHLKVIDGKVEYYTGFAWSESKQFAGKKEWEAYLTDFAKRIQSPVVVTVEKE